MMQLGNSNLQDLLQCTPGLAVNAPDSASRAAPGLLSLVPKQPECTVGALLNLADASAHVPLSVSRARFCVDGNE